MITLLRRWFPKLFRCRQVCMWCSTVLQRRGIFGPLQMSHGACDTCVQRERAAFIARRDELELRPRGIFFIKTRSDA